MLRPLTDYPLDEIEPFKHRPSLTVSLQTFKLKPTTYRLYHAELPQSPLMAQTAHWRVAGPAVAPAPAPLPRNLILGTPGFFR